MYRNNELIIKRCKALLLHNKGVKVLKDRTRWNYMDVIYDSIWANRTLRNFWNNKDLQGIIDYLTPNN